MKAGWKEIITGVISLIILSSVGFVFSSTNSRIEAMENSNTILVSTVSEISLIMEKDLRRSISDLTEELDDVSGLVSLSSNNQISITRDVDRLQLIVERLEK